MTLLIHRLRISTRILDLSVRASSSGMARLTLSVGMLCVAALVGCETDKQLRYLGDATLSHYRDYANSIDYTDVQQSPRGDVISSAPPRTVRDRSHDEVRDMTLDEAVQIALENCRILRIQPISITSQGTVVRDSNVLNAPNTAQSVYDPAIQETGVLFGGRGVEAALADFDAQFKTDVTWGRNENLVNNPFFGSGLIGGGTFVQDSSDVDISLSKTFGNGGSISAFHSWDYRSNNSPGQLFGSAYGGVAGLNYRLPLLAGSGTEFTRIAGPFNPAFGNIAGVTQGVVIARINQDLSLVQFKRQVQDLVTEVHRSYWDLYCMYRQYDAAVKARERSREFWRKMDVTLKAGGNQGFKIAHEREARATYFSNKAQAETALSAIYEAESAFRMLLKLEVNDSGIIRPVDEPTMTQSDFDWRVSLTEALVNRTELHSQKWNIKSLQFQLKAAQSLTRPSFDFVSGYQVNGFGDHLLTFGDDDDVRRTPQGLNSAYETILQGNQTGWNLGVSFSMPLGFRSALAQVRNYELRLAKARHILSSQEQEIAGQLANGFQQVDKHYTVMKSNWNYLDAARKTLHQYDVTEKFGGPVNESSAAFFNAQLRAQQTLIQAERAFYQSVCDYNKSIADLIAHKGTVLEHFKVGLSENTWTPAAYREAVRRAWSRSHAIESNLMHTEPSEFVRPGAYGPPELGSPVTTPFDPKPVPTPEDSADVTPAGDLDNEIPESVPAPPLNPFEADAPKTPAPQGAPTPSKPIRQSIEKDDQVQTKSNSTPVPVKLIQSNVVAPTSRPRTRQSGVETTLKIPPAPSATRN